MNEPELRAWTLALPTDPAALDALVAELAAARAQAEAEVTAATPAAGRGLMLARRARDLLDSQLAIIAHERSRQ